MAELHKVMDGRDVAYTVRAVNEGSDHNGEPLRRLEHCEGDSGVVEDYGDVEWIEGLPALNQKQWAALCIWICGVDGPGSPHQGRE